MALAFESIESTSACRALLKVYVPGCVERRLRSRLIPFGLVSAAVASQSTVGVCDRDKFRGEDAVRTCIDYIQHEMAHICEFIQFEMRVLVRLRYFLFKRLTIVPVPGCHFGVKTVRHPGAAADINYNGI
eukprot:2042189-Pleurochrysis_carterae.AAC.1